jgi:hypothetical protein
LEKRLWDAVDRSGANSCLRPRGHSGPILGLRFAEFRLTTQWPMPVKAGASVRRASRIEDRAAYHAEDILCRCAEARFDYPVNRHGGNANSYYAGPHDTTGCLDFVFSRSGLTQ